MQQNQTARTNYLQAEVHTATPQKLQLLLIEAAIKNIHRTRQAWKDQRLEDSFESLSRAQDIVAEILCSLDVESNPDIAKKLASIYIFIFRRLAEAGMTYEEEKLDDALRVLTSERETWRLVCEKFGSTVTEPSAEGQVGVSAVGQSAQYTPSAATGSSAALDLSAKSGETKTSAGYSAPSSTTFSRPPGAAWGRNVRPLGASAIQTDSTLAGGQPSTAPLGTSNAAKPDAESGKTTLYTTLGAGKITSNLNVNPAMAPLGPVKSPTPVASSIDSGNNWEV